MTKPTPLKQAVDRMGGQAGMAAALQVSPGLVWQWLNGRRPVAADHCPAIERHSRVKCERLRPDLQWIRDQSGRVTGHLVPLKTG